MYLGDWNQLETFGIELNDDYSYFYFKRQSVQSVLQTDPKRIKIRQAISTICSGTPHLYSEHQSTKRST